MISPAVAKRVMQCLLPATIAGGCGGVGSHGEDGLNSGGEGDLLLREAVQRAISYGATFIVTSSHVVEGSHVATKGPLARQVHLR